MITDSKICALLFFKAGEAAASYIGGTSKLSLLRVRDTMVDIPRLTIANWRSFAVNYQIQQEGKFLYQLRDQLQNTLHQ